MLLLLFDAAVTLAASTGYLACEDPALQARFGDLAVRGAGYLFLDGLQMIRTERGM